MTIDQLIFVGFRGYALALDRETGEIVWCNNKLRSGYVSMLLDGDRLIVSCNGYMYCLHPLTGEVLWHNPLSGYGVGVAHLVSVRGQSSQTVIAEAAAEEEAAARSSRSMNSDR
jgi:outer membrane protein assembly factor BamB